jgi:hypothetical protein
MATFPFATDLCAKIAFVLGVPLNALLFWLILRHTPKEMRVYSQILMQTCVMDLVILGVLQLAQTVCFTFFVFVFRFYYPRKCTWTKDFNRLWSSAPREAFRFLGRFLPQIFASFASSSPSTVLPSNSSPAT